MLELMGYEGCGGCEKCDNNFDCDANTKKVKITFKKPVKWDNCGKMVTAFRKGEVVEGKAVIDGNKVYCVSARSNIWDVEDFVWTECIENVEIVN